MKNSPNGHENKTPEPTNQWKSVSIDNVDVYIPWNAPVEVLGQTFVCGQVESGDKVIVLSNVKGKRAGDGD